MNGVSYIPQSSTVAPMVNHGKPSQKPTIYGGLSPMVMDREKMINFAIDSIVNLCKPITQHAKLQASPVASTLETCQIMLLNSTEGWKCYEVLTILLKVSNLEQFYRA